MAQPSDQPYQASAAPPLNVDTRRKLFVQFRGHLHTTFLNIAGALLAASCGTHNALQKRTPTKVNVVAAACDGVNEHDPAQGPGLPPQHLLA